LHKKEGSAVQKLFGVDDPCEEKAIRAALERYKQSRKWHWTWGDLILFIALGLAFVFTELTGIPRPYSHLVFGAFAYGGMRVADLFRKKELDRALEGILRELGRCTGCGYHLKEGIGITCPECGQSRT
jgi:hypothetical protein